MTEDQSFFYKSMEPNYIAMGTMLHAWDNLEGGWGYLFETLLLDHPYAQRLLFSSSAFSAKAKMIERILEVSGSPQKETVEGLLNRTNKISQRRNDVVHGIWIGLAPGKTIRVAVKKDHDDSAAVAAAYISKKDQKVADRAYDNAKMLRLADDLQALAEEVYGIAEKIRSSFATQ